jgi:hypothetical protein
MQKIAMIGKLKFFTRYWNVNALYYPLLEHLKYCFSKSLSFFIGHNNNTESWEQLFHIREKNTSCSLGNYHKEKIVSISAKKSVVAFKK